MGMLIRLFVAGMVAACFQLPVMAAQLVFEEDGLVLGLDQNAPLGRIADIALDSKGRIYVLDAGFTTVRRYLADGTHDTDLGREGEAPGEFYSPRAIAVSPDDRLFVAGGSGVITVINPDGTPGESIQNPVSGGVRSMIFAPDGTLFVVAADVYRKEVIHAFSPPSLEYDRSFCDLRGTRTDAVAMASAAAYGGGFIDTDGDFLYFVRQTPQEILVFTFAGELVSQFATRYTRSPPKPEASGGVITLRMPEMTTFAVSLGQGRILTALFTPSEKEGESGSSVVDLIDAKKERIIASREDGAGAFKVVDSEGRVYGVSTREDAEGETVPVVVRARVAVN